MVLVDALPGSPCRAKTASEPLGDRLDGLEAVDLAVELWDERREDSKRSRATAPTPRSHRLEQLRDIHVSGRWVSFDPSIGPIGDVALDRIDRVVGGG